MSAGLSDSRSFGAPGARGGLRRLIGPVLLPRAFDLTNPMNIIRILAGLYYAPHVWQKLSGIEASLAFFGKAGLVPAPLFLGLALLCEGAAFIGLTAGLLARWVPLLSAGCMVVAAYAMIETRGLNWYWAKGGIEYLVFWGIVSLAIALDAWRRTER
ncbi:DoxX family protein [Roseomonas sp. GC11]|uniref:DoxX family protein n=1 Tax=Roseomonas sp. GC11 TaxID=2950546 RepID=UPI00210E106D|nr:DoxX family protein [Roseomonas sp. GC11]MCQ4158847.1 DoxX family protein [Roseomonas sp. GC11]